MSHEIMKREWPKVTLTTLDHASTLEREFSLYFEFGVSMRVSRDELAHLNIDWITAALENKLNRLLREWANQDG